MGPDGTFGGGGRTGRGRQWPSDPEEIMRGLETLRKNADEQLRRYVEAREEAGDLTSEGYSEDGSVRAELDDGGQVVAIDIPDSALGRLSHLGHMVLEAIREAQAAHALKMADIAARMGSPLDIESMVKDAIPADVRDSLERRDERRY
ncbi:MAG TPA: YbaB/EbfC family nucleoid-associated protein [Phytomonospora sp.]